MATDANGSSDRLLHYVERALELQEAGAELSVDELCREHPELVSGVNAALAQKGLLGAWAAAGQREGSRGGEEHRRGDGEREDPFIGRVLADRYHLQGRIGVGAMGTVYRAEDLELKREVALKLMLPYLVGSERVEPRFTREAEILAALRHPHVVAVHDRGRTDDGLHYLVMELLHGMPLSEVLADLRERVDAGDWQSVHDVQWLERRLPGAQLAERSYIRLAVRWTAEVASGLAAAHAAGIFHRDVKPSNVYVAADGRALLLDFGIAARAADPTLTSDSTMLGTPRYMAPEQALGRAEPGPQLDVYSLCATLYHMLAATAPYSGDARAVLVALQRREPASLARRNQGLPGDLVAITECGMARNPRRRYASAAALEADLRAFLDHRPVTARLRGPLARAWRRVRKSRAAQATALMALVAMLAILVVGWLDERELGRHAEHLTIVAGFPPTMTLGKQPVISDEARRRALFQQLDRAVALRPDDIATRIVRAAFRLDHGDAAGAARDVAALAGAAATAYTAELVVRYRAAAAADGKASLRLDGLPSPSDANDRFLAGYHALRANDPATAEALLTGAAPDESWGFGLVARLSVHMRRGEIERLQRVHDDALQLEGRLGRRTARSCYVIGTALAALERFGDAIQPFEDLHELTPPAFGSLLNLGSCYFNVEDYDAAQDLLQRAVEARPSSARALSQLAKCLAQQQQFELALETTQRIAEGTVPNWRDEAAGYIETVRAVGLLADDASSAAAAARRAVEHYRGITRQDPNWQLVQTNVSLAGAMADGDWDAFVVSLCDRLSQSPTNEGHLRNLADKMPQELDRTQTRALRQLLGNIADAVGAQRERTAAVRKEQSTRTKESHR